MKRIKDYIRNNGGTICVLLALVLFLISLLLNTSKGHRSHRAQTFLPNREKDGDS